jgi:hypothetical protein
MLWGSYHPGHNQPRCSFEVEDVARSLEEGTPANPSRLEATTVHRRALRDLPREVSPSPTSLVASLATNPMTVRTRRLLLHP